MVLVSKRGRFLVGELVFERGGQIELAGGRRAATPGRMALVELGQGRGRARVVRQLGDPRLAADVLDAMLEDRQIRVGFSRRIEEDAGEAAARAAALDVDRRDLRDLPTFTVDPASAHDFDDAVSASRTERGVRLWIHIADVAAHVRPRAPLEKEAYRRANSTSSTSRDSSWRLESSRVSASVEACWKRVLLAMAAATWSAKTLRVSRSSSVKALRWSGPSR